MKNKLIFCILGVTSSGKTTLSSEVSNRLGVPILTQCTSRPIREGESPDAYKFVDNEYFDNNEFIEQREYLVANGDTWRYGLQTNNIDNYIYAMYVCDRNAYETLANKLGEDRVISIFIETDIEDIIKRQNLRGDSSKEFKRRLEDDINKFKGFISDYVVVNDDLDLAIKKLQHIIAEEMVELEI